MEQNRTLISQWIERERWWQERERRNRESDIEREKAKEGERERERDHTIFSLMPHPPYSTSLCENELMYI
jgi:endonuclease IV